jgi:excisionase family DNA binding protein
MNSIKAKPASTIPEKLEARTDFIKPKEAMRIIGTDKNTLARWVREGTIPATRIGKSNRFDPGKLAAWLREREIG